jgi:hypothetical protein
MLRYKLRTATIAVHTKATHPIAITIPAEALLSVSADDFSATGFVDVDWDGKRVQIFAVDLRNRGHYHRGHANLAPTQK